MPEGSPPAAPAATPSPNPTAAPATRTSAPVAAATTKVGDTTKSVGASTPAAPGPKPLPHQEAAPAGGTSETPANNDHPAAEPGETKAETIQRLKFKVKVRGQEMEREFTPDEAQLHIQKGLAFDANAQETAQIRKTFQSFVEAVKADPFAAFQDPAFGDLGKNFEQLVIEKLAKKFNDQDLQQKDPREYELQQLRDEKAKWEAQQNSVREAQQKQAQEEADRRYWAETQKSWDAALDKAGLGKNPHYYRQMAMIGQEFMEANMDLSPELLVSELKTRIADSNRLIFSGLKGPALVNALGPELVQEILATKVAEIKATKAAPPPIEPAPAENRQKKPEPEQALRNWADFKRTLR